MKHQVCVSIGSGLIILIVMGSALAQRPLRGVPQPADSTPPVPPNFEMPLPAEEGAAPEVPQALAPQSPASPAAAAQGPASPAAAAPGRGRSAAAAPSSLRDPTIPNARMRDVLNTRTAAGAKLSPLSLRGRIIARNKPPTALLEVEGKLYAVTKGSVVTGPGGTVLRVLDIDSAGVRVESSGSPRKEVFSLR
jgi:hypothetical protein